MKTINNNTLYGFLIFLAFDLSLPSCQKENPNTTTIVEPKQYIKTDPAEILFGNLIDNNYEVYSYQKTSEGHVFVFHDPKPIKNYPEAISNITLPLDIVNNVKETNTYYEVEFNTKNKKSIKRFSEFSIDLDPEITFSEYTGRVVEFPFSITKNNYNAVEIYQVNVIPSNAATVDVSINENLKDGIISITPIEKKGKVSVIFSNGVLYSEHQLQFETYYLEKNGSWNDINDVPVDGMEYTLYLNTNLPDEKIIVTSEDYIDIKYNKHVIKINAKKNSLSNYRNFKVSVTDDENIFPAIIANFRQDYTLTNAPGMVQFTDKAFKEAVLAVADNNKDNDISIDEALTITKLELKNKGIKNLDGLREFKNIEWLDVSYNQLDEIILNDIGAFSKLKYVNPAKNNYGFKLNLTGCYPGPEFKYEYPETYFVWDETVLPYESTDYSHDGTVETYQQHTKGAGINIVFFSHSLDVDYNNGLQKKLINGIIDRFFTTAPLESFKEYFNIYVFYNVDKTLDIHETQDYRPLSDYQNQFLTKLEADNKSYKVYFLEKINEIIDPLGLAASPISSDCKKIWLKYILRKNSHDVGKVFVHEMGHALGHLNDQYKETSGDSYNFSEYNDPTIVKWKKFLNHPNYKDRVIIYDKGWGYYPNDGNNNYMDGSLKYIEPYFDSPSRFSIFLNIYKEANKIRFPDEDELFEEFVEYDVVNNNIPI